MGMYGGRRRLVVVSVAGCGDRHCILPQMSLLGGGVCCFTVYSTGWRLCGCGVLYMGCRLFYGQAVVFYWSACHWLASLGVWEIVITWILICSQWAHGCGV